VNEISDTERIRTHTKRFGRELAMQYLYCCEQKDELPGTGGFEELLETVKNEFELKDGHLTRKGGEYARELFELVTLHQDEIDQELRKHCKNWDFDRISSVERNIMRVAVAEMRFLPDLPDAVSISEAVEIARDYAGSEGGNFINGILNAVKDSGKKRR